MIKLIWICGFCFLVFILTACSAQQGSASNDSAAIESIQPFDITISEDSMKDPYGIAVNSKGQIFVTDAGNHRVLIFDDKGTLTSKWDRQGSGLGEFKTLGFGGIAIDGNDNVFVVDNGNYRIQKFDAKGNVVTEWGTKGTGNKQFVRAIGIATDVEGNVYVTDDGNPYIQKFDNDGNFIMRFGGEGDGNGAFRHATGIAIDSEGNIFVADYETKRVQKFDPTGTFLVSWMLDMEGTSPGTPEGIGIDDKGQVYVTDYDLGQVHVFDNNGVFKWSLSEKIETATGFNRPTAIEIAAGKIHIVNQSSARISVFPITE